MARVDLHLHTHFSSDSSQRPVDLVRKAERAGLTHIAVTDHGGVAGAYAARESATTVEVIVGQEVRTSAGEILALFIEEPIPDRLSAGLAAARVRAQGGLVVAAHPFDPLRRALGTAGLTELGSAVDAIEGYNGRTALRRRDGQARRWAMDHSLPVTLGSDAHTTGEVGRSWLALPDFDGPGELLRVLPEGRADPARWAPWYLPLSGWALVRHRLGWRPAAPGSAP